MWLRVVSQALPISMFASFFEQQMSRLFLKKVSSEYTTVLYEFTYFPQDWYILY